MSEKLLEYTTNYTDKIVYKMLQKKGLSVKIVSDGLFEISQLSRTNCSVVRRTFDKMKAIEIIKSTIVLIDIEKI